VKAQSKRKWKIEAVETHYDMRERKGDKVGNGRQLPIFEPERFQVASGNSLPVPEFSLI